MKNEGVDALLIGESARSFSHIVKRLEKAGCRCDFATSYEEAMQKLEKETFDLVLSVVRPEDGAIASLVERLAGSGASFYYAHPVEEGCWWLPALRRGEQCFGRPALRPSEFAGVLDQVVAELRGDKTEEPEPVISVVVIPEKAGARETREAELLAHHKTAAG
jgi:hypothetical protein